MPPTLVTVPRVEIARVGTWDAATGRIEFTAAMFADAVAAQANPAWRKGILKVGHTDPRFTDGQILGDGEPAVGRLVNLDTDGQSLFADLEGVPEWIAEVMATAWPSRSIEGMTDVTAPDGTHYDLVITGLALLGVAPPAIQSLADVERWLTGPAVAAAGWAGTALAATAIPDPRPLGHLIPPRERITMSAKIDDVQAAFDEWARGVPALGSDCYVRDWWTDMLVAVAWSGDDARFWRITFTTTDGKITFGDPVEVRPTYEEVPVAPVAASGMPGPATPTSEPARVDYANPLPALASARGRISETSTEETPVPLAPALAERLGVPADADDDTVAAAIDAIKAAATPPAPPGDTPDLDAQIAAAVEKATAPLMTQIEATTGELATLKAKEAAAAKAAVLSAALAAGKIKPADEEQWSKDYDEAPQVVTGLLNRIAAGAAVPVVASGHAGSPETTESDPYAEIYGTKGGDV